jgi:hypothetical protein
VVGQVQHEASAPSRHVGMSDGSFEEERWEDNRVAYGLHLRPMKANQLLEKENQLEGVP